ncbi:MAG: HAD-IA family hydrolase [Betaproteobacteria bacterium]
MLPASALLLDMDGVLVDSTGDVLKHWMQWADRRGVDPAEVARHAHGAPSREVVARFVPAEEVDAEADWVEQLSLREREEHALPGAARLLGQRELPVAVATSATGRVARLRLRNAGLPIPDVLVTADDVARGKPDPQPYLKAARQLGVPPERCVGVDDTPAGLASLIAAGATPIAVATTYPAGELGAALAVLPDLYNIRIVEGGIVWTRAAEAAARPDA